MPFLPLSSKPRRAPERLLLRTQALRQPAQFTPRRVKIVSKVQPSPVAKQFAKLVKRRGLELRRLVGITVHQFEQTLLVVNDDLRGVQLSQLGNTCASIFDLRFVDIRRE